jgi:S1-C subfamily serine protease
VRDDHGLIRRTLTSVAALAAVAFGAGGCGGDAEPTSTASSQAPTTPEALNRDFDAADFLGATLTSATAGEPGAVVQAVEPESKSQLKRGDVIVALNGSPVAGAGELVRRIGSPKVGEQFTIKVVRGSRRFTLTEVQSPSAYLGAEVRDTTGEEEGAAVVSVAPNSPASATGLRRGDVITAVDDASVDSADGLIDAISTHRPGDTVTITATRDSRDLEMTVTLADRPPPGG